MSHFAVAVVTEDSNSVDIMLEPFDANLDDKDSEFTEFQDLTEDLLKEWEEYRKGISETELKAQIAVGTLKYATIEEFMEDSGYCSDENGSWGYFANPCSKWDWYTIGGRWSNYLILKSSTKSVNTALIQDIDFKAVMQHTKECEYAQKKNFGLTNLTKEQYMAQKYNESTTTFAFAFITPDGKWIEPDSTAQDSIKKYKHQWEELLKEIDPSKTYITIVDCHF